MRTVEVNAFSDEIFVCGRFAFTARIVSRSRRAAVMRWKSFPFESQLYSIETDSTFVSTDLDKWDVKQRSQLLELCRLLTDAHGAMVRWSLGIPGLHEPSCTN